MSIRPPKGWKKSKTQTPVGRVVQFSTTYEDVSGHRVRVWQSGSIAKGWYVEANYTWSGTGGLRESRAWELSKTRAERLAVKIMNLTVEDRRNRWPGKMGRR